MGLRDPIAVYNAASNLDAMQVCGMLEAAGIEAHTVEDMSPAGMWMFGLIPEIHKPQVWIERASVERVMPLLAEYERRAVERRKVDSDSTIEVVCEECKKTSQFPAARRGGVETCPHCGAYVDVGDDGGLDGWEGDGSPEEGDT